MNTFTCIGRSHGAPAIPATREDWENLRRNPKLADMCRRIAMGHEKVKRKLPVWTPSCAEFKNNHRAVKDAAKPLQRLMLDFDQKGHSKEILERSMQLHEAGKWEILLVEESVRKGTHVLISLPHGMTPQEAQQRFSEDVGFMADPALKDVSRCIYMVPHNFTLYVNERMFSIADVDNFRHGLHGLHGAHPLPDETSGRLDDTETGDKSASSNQPNATETPGNENPCNPCHPCLKEETSTYPETYEEIPYSTLVETLEEQMGGRPEHGSRNNFIFSMACHLRYVCDDDANWIAQVLPTYGEEREKFLTTVKSACNRNQTKQMPRIMQRTLAICKSQGDRQVSEIETPPELPSKLPPLIELLVSRTPEIYRPAVAHAVFPSLGTHLWQTTFRYIDNTLHEATLATLLMAPTGSGKSCVNNPIDYIMADIRERDRLSMEKERNWKRDTQSKGANKDKKQRPEGIVIQEIDPDSTSAAFVQRMADAEGRFLYARMNEIQQLNNLSSRGSTNNVFDLMCLAFDYGNIYGQTRVGTGSVSERVCVRFNYNVSTTVRKGQAFFRRVLTDGPVSRLNVCTIPERAIGSEMPVYGTYGPDFAEQLKPYITHLNAARGLIECTEASALAKALVAECADFARLSQSRVYENLSFRANVIAFIKAMVLYVAHGEVWSPEMEDFIRWSLQYDLWCKMQFFGKDIEDEEEGGNGRPARGPQNLLGQLPDIFTREEAGQMRQRLGVRGGSLRQMLNNWKSRGYIDYYGEVMPRNHTDRQRYIKTEEYHRTHPQG